MVKNILFDFDGVILDSMKIKADGFYFLFSEYGEHECEEMTAYHYANGGVSRFEKIRYFFREILHKEISEQNVQVLADKFGKIIQEKLLDEQNLIADTLAYIKENCAQYRMHIVSGAENEELNTICRHFKLTEYFITIEGSPTPKKELVKNLISTSGYKKDETILIGDSVNDYDAATVNGIRFYGYNNDDLKQCTVDYIETFQEFKT